MIEIDLSAQREQQGRDPHRDDDPDAPPDEASPPVAGEDQGHAEEDEHEHDEHDAHAVEQMHGAFRLVELVGVEQGDLEVLLILGETVEDGDAALVEPFDDLIDDR